MTTADRPADTAAVPSSADVASSTPRPESDSPGAAATSPPRRPGLNTDTLALAGVFIAMFAFLGSIFAVALASRAVDEHRDLGRILEAGEVDTGGPSEASVAISLTEFRVSPDPVTISGDQTSLAVTNDGTVPHNLGVDGAATPMLDAGDSADLDVSALEPGTYTLICQVAGHEAAGMKATLTIE